MWCAGETILDLIAVAEDWQSVIGCHAGLARALGWPQEGYLASEPTLVFQSPAHWLLGGMRGIYPIGRGWEVADFLRGFDVPLIAESVEHGLAIEKKLRRDYTMPEIRVAA